MSSQSQLLSYILASFSATLVIILLLLVLYLCHLRTRSSRRRKSMMGEKDPKAVEDQHGRSNVYTLPEFPFGETETEDVQRPLRGPAALTSRRTNMPRSSRSSNEAAAPTSYNNVCDHNCFEMIPYLPHSQLSSSSITNKFGNSTRSLASIESPSHVQAHTSTISTTRKLQNQQLNVQTENRRLRNDKSRRGPPNYTDDVHRSGSQQPSDTKERKRSGSQKPSDTKERKRSGSQKPSDTKERKRSGSQKPSDTKEGKRSGSQKPSDTKEGKRSGSQKPSDTKDKTRSRSQQPSDIKDKKRSRSQQASDTKNKKRSASQKPSDKNSTGEKGRKVKRKEGRPMSAVEATRAQGTNVLKKNSRGIPKITGDQLHLDSKDLRGRIRRKNPANRPALALEHIF